MPVFRTAGTARHSDHIDPAALVLAWVIAAAAKPWTSEALSAQIDPDLFFSDSASKIALAKSTCWQCPVRGECLSHALEAGEEFGVWGGLDRDERRRLQRSKARPQTTGQA